MILLRLKLLFVLATIISLGGCQTIPSSSTQSLKKTFEVQPPLGKASLVLIRPFYVTYGIRSLSVKINATPVVELSNKSHTVLYVNPGNQKIESEGGFLSWSKKEKMVETTENKVTYVLWYIQDGLDGYADKVFNAQWQVVPKEVAVQYLNGSKYVPSAHAL
jgi:hypothetical protein